MAWMLRLVKIGVEGEGPCTDIMEIRRPDDLVDITNLGLTLAEAQGHSVLPVGPEPASSSGNDGNVVTPANRGFSL